MSRIVETLLSPAAERTANMLLPALPDPAGMGPRQRLYAAQSALASEQAAAAKFPAGWALVGASVGVLWALSMWG